ncbi:hypothetical protein Tco_1123984 [Tanacetum coccineum]|uniref:Uncharacterized protein n=1 Tax=Tanacetum coccineum TaxID=301880 RepID=A0ABQ5J510_9ASTR
MHVKLGKMIGIFEVLIKRVSPLWWTYPATTPPQRRRRLEKGWHDGCYGGSVVVRRREGLKVAAGGVTWWPAASVVFAGKTADGGCGRWLRCGGDEGVWWWLWDRRDWGATRVGEGTAILAGIINRKGSSKRAGEELEQESIKKQKVDEDRETIELQSLIKVILDEEEVAIDDVPLATKPPSIVDWKIHKEGKISYYQIIRADRKSQMYKVFSQMLKSFSKEDLEDLYKLVKPKYGSTRPVEDLDLIYMEI